MSSTSVVVRELGLCEYETTLVSMQAFTNGRKKDTQDEIWLLQHPPVFTRGVSCRQLPNRLLPSTMKVVDSARGGQITYHGPGQLVVYLLLDLRRRQLAASLVAEGQCPGRPLPGALGQDQRGGAQRSLRGRRHLGGEPAEGGGRFSPGAWSRAAPVDLRGCWRGDDSGGTGDDLPACGSR